MRHSRHRIETKGLCVRLIRHRRMHLPQRKSFILFRVADVADSRRDWHRNEESPFRHASSRNFERQQHIRFTYFGIRPRPFIFGSAVTALASTIRLFGRKEGLDCSSCSPRKRGPKPAYMKSAIHKRTHAEFPFVIPKKAATIAASAIGYPR